MTPTIAEKRAPLRRTAPRRPAASSCRTRSTSARRNISLPSASRRWRARAPAWRSRRDWPTARSRGHMRSSTSASLPRAADLPAQRRLRGRLRPRRRGRARKRAPLRRRRRRRLFDRGLHRRSRRAALRSERSRRPAARGARGDQRQRRDGAFDRAQRGDPASGRRPCPKLCAASPLTPKPAPTCSMRR